MGKEYLENPAQTDATHKPSDRAGHEWHGSRLEQEYQKLIRDADWKSRHRLALAWNRLNAIEPYETSGRESKVYIAYTRMNPNDRAYLSKTDADKTDIIERIFGPAKNLNADQRQNIERLTKDDDLFLFFVAAMTKEKDLDAWTILHDLLGHASMQDIRHWSELNRCGISAEDRFIDQTNVAIPRIRITPFMEELLRHPSEQELTSVLACAIGRSLTNNDLAHLLEWLSTHPAQKDRVELACLAARLCDPNGSIYFQNWNVTQAVIAIHTSAPEAKAFILGDDFPGFIKAVQLFLQHVLGVEEFMKIRQAYLYLPPPSRQRTVDK